MTTVHLSLANVKLQTASGNEKFQTKMDSSRDIRWLRIDLFKSDDHLRLENFKKFKFIPRVV